MQTAVTPTLASTLDLAESPGERIQLALVTTWLAQPRPEFETEISRASAPAPVPMKGATASIEGDAS